jgi:type IV secretion system protein VirB5
MSSCKRYRMCLLILLLAAPTARAQWAVIDVGAIAQLMQEVATLEQALATARTQLQQAQQEYQSISGDRGMERLLAGTVRNYLPSSWGELQGAVGAGAYGGFASTIQQSLAVNSVLSAQQLSALPPDAVAHLQRIRTASALLQGIVVHALSVNSERFASLQQLIDAIGSAADQKATLDLHARIAAEQAMLQNEQTKLQVLYQAIEASDSSDRQRSREAVVAGHGTFASRFQPAP